MKYHDILNMRSISRFLVLLKSSDLLILPPPCRSAPQLHRHRCPQWLRSQHAATAPTRREQIRWWRKYKGEVDCQAKKKLGTISRYILAINFIIWKKHKLPMLSEGQNGGDDDRHGDRHVHDDEPLRRELRLWRLQENNENIDQINGWRNHNWIRHFHKVIGHKLIFIILKRKVAFELTYWLHLMIMPGETSALFSCGSFELSSSATLPCSIATNGKEACFIILLNDYHIQPLIIIILTRCLSKHQLTYRMWKLKNHRRRSILLPCSSMWVSRYDP